MSSSCSRWMKKDLWRGFMDRQFPPLRSHSIPMLDDQFINLQTYCCSDFFSQFNPSESLYTHSSPSSIQTMVPVLKIALVISTGFAALVLATQVVCLVSTLYWHYLSLLYSNITGARVFTFSCNTPVDIELCNLHLLVMSHC